MLISKPFLLNKLKKKLKTTLDLSVQALSVIYLVSSARMKSQISLARYNLWDLTANYLLRIARIKMFQSRWTSSSLATPVAQLTKRVLISKILIRLESLHLIKRRLVELKVVLSPVRSGEDQHLCRKTRQTYQYIPNSMTKMSKQDIRSIRQSSSDECSNYPLWKKTISCRGSLLLCKGWALAKKVLRLK